ncbi:MULTISPECIES: reverse transcriptase family protein [unclassified Methylophaga]|jgi:RNA-directed DNA polymerase|uniref:RNA-directed DNA polymerase n=1 Tax=Pseudidiomarina aestuarii TaxID=624146 RepID=A0A2T4CYN0_9GAMM|nr:MULTISPECIES: reverse transcriptase family protein [unclassified Methylophaga]PTB86673.1 RNA-directed DNA polymerase [Pseudidiomarina aestuarii]MAL50533.1 RNA-directed DNA polymerase [Methylophaga sp.]MAP25786.1 RNA-directed DNA polymerase [Methylophaga sp.]MBP25145.1 RNA-directed DNA polymerase [Methylophaga sp.]HAD31696.1 RNA-directed DNA polymerase [Methylophaga sp.]|tara:strand:+ start:14245 stop:15339 length:1095 start_codon:yes stop_codon:yes gene_type:complete
MGRKHSQLFFTHDSQEISASSNCLPPIKSLKHLADLTETSYRDLRKIITRQSPEPYKVFRIRKKSGGFRIIAIPDESLLKVQQWIYRHILSQAQPSPVSYAFQKGKSIRDAASVHCGCRWLIKLDLYNFFGAISEIDVYRVFYSLGYQPLIAFELARLCTRLGSLTAFRHRHRWEIEGNSTIISQYQGQRMGHLPQGAPTSPALSNLAMVAFDRKIMNLAAEEQLTYSRYADDLSFSTPLTSFSRELAKAFIHRVFRLMRTYGQSPNMTKTKIITPGARKIVLGLLVDGEEPRLQKSVRNHIRQHIFYLNHSDVGLQKHAQKRGFLSTDGFKAHLDGVLSYVHDIDPSLAQNYRHQLADVYRLV